MADYKSDYKAHLSDVFALFVSDDRIKTRREIKLPAGTSLVDHILLTDENMEKYWWPAITHISYDIRPDKNWENPELLGDGYADAVFNDFFMDRYPNQTQLFYSETRNYYLSNEYIATITRDILQLGDFIRIKGIKTPTDSMFADCFESFCGALIKTGNKSSPGFGSTLLLYFVEYIFGNIDVNDIIERTFGKSTTQLEQIMRRLGIQEIKPYVTVEDYIYSYEYSLNRGQIEALNKLLIGKQIKVSNKLVIGQSKGRGKYAMKDQAADMAFAFLKGYGINTPWSQNIKNKRDLNNPKVKELAAAGLSKARKAGFSMISFREIDKSDTDDFIVIVLVGVKADGYQESLDVIAVDKQIDKLKRNVVITNGHKSVLEHYLNG